MLLSAWSTGPSAQLANSTGGTFTDVLDKVSTQPPSARERSGAPPGRSERPPGSDAVKSAGPRKEVAKPEPNAPSQRPDPSRSRDNSQTTSTQGQGSSSPPANRAKGKVGKDGSIPAASVIGSPDPNAVAQALMSASGQLAPAPVVGEQSAPTADGTAEKALTSEIIAGIQAPTDGVPKLTNGNSTGDVNSIAAATPDASQGTASGAQDDNAQAVVASAPSSVTSQANLILGLGKVSSNAKTPDAQTQAGLSQSGPGLASTTMSTVNQSQVTTPDGVNAMVVPATNSTLNAGSGPKVHDNASPVSLGTIPTVQADGGPTAAQSSGASSHRPTSEGQTLANPTATKLPDAQTAVNVQSVGAATTNAQVMVKGGAGLVPQAKGETDAKVFPVDVAAPEPGVTDVASRENLGQSAGDNPKHSGTGETNSGAFSDEMVASQDSVGSDLGVATGVGATKASDAPTASQSLSASNRSLVIRQVADRIELLAASRPSSGVVIHLEPRDLGSITLVVKSQGDSVDAQLYASHDHVRSALQQSHAQLGQSLQQRGIQLGSVSVGAQADFSHGPNNPSANSNEGQPKPAFNSNHSQNNRNLIQEARSLDEVRAVRRTAGMDIWI